MGDNGDGDLFQKSNFLEEEENVSYENIV